MTTLDAIVFTVAIVAVIAISWLRARSLRRRVPPATRYLLERSYRARRLDISIPLASSRFDDGATR